MFCIIRLNAFAHGDFDHQNLTFMQNKSDSQFFYTENVYYNIRPHRHPLLFYQILAYSVLQVEL